MFNAVVSSKAADAAAAGVLYCPLSDDSASAVETLSIDLEIVSPVRTIAFGFYATNNVIVRGYSEFPLRVLDNPAGGLIDTRKGRSSVLALLVLHTRALPARLPA